MLVQMVIKFKYIFYLTKYFLGSNFCPTNYVNEYEFVYWIKSGGYGKVYMGMYI